MRIFFLVFPAVLLCLNVNADIVRTISVTGVVEKSFVPDIVRVNLNIWGKGSNAKEAQRNNSLRFEATKKILNNFKIKKEDIKTLSYDLNPDYFFDQKSNKNVIQGYNCNQTISLTIRGIEEAGPFLDQLIPVDQKKDVSGLNINNLSFDLDQRNEEEKNLLAQAVKAAQQQAQNLADAAGVKLKGVYRLSPRGTQISQPFVADMQMESAPMLRQKSVGTSLMSGEIKVSGEVSVDYLIE